MKTILLTGSTDGIGLETAKMLAKEGHFLLLHGRSREKLNRVQEQIKIINPKIMVETYVADLSILSEVQKLGQEILNYGTTLDVIINNAGVFVMENPITKDKLDARFVVNTIAPYLLTKILLPSMNPEGRVVNVSSAAQAPVNCNLIRTGGRVSDGEAYAQSKLAIIMWSMELAKENPDKVIVSVNPKSFLGSKMVKQAYGREGYDLAIGADILCRAALSNEFLDANGKYYDNDTCRFANPEPSALNETNREKLMNTLEQIVGS